ncbi:hypothetical protein MTO96_026616 [Rhipicephalus appendiculatus]
MVAWRYGVVQESRRQLGEVCREAVQLRVRVALGGEPAPGRSFEDVVAGRRDAAAAFSSSLGPLGVQRPPPDNTNLAQVGIGDVNLRQTHSGATMLASRTVHPLIILSWLSKPLR